MASSRASIRAIAAPRIHTWGRQRERELRAPDRGCAGHCPAIAGCGLFGTINVRLDQPIDKGHADCWTPLIPWKPKVMGGQPWDQTKDRWEEFGFTSIV